MRMPSRRDFSDKNEFAMAIGDWCRINELAVKEAVQLYESTMVTNSVPEWITGFNKDCSYKLRNVFYPEKPVQIGPAINALVGNAEKENLKISRFWHGSKDGWWAIYAELK